MLMLWITTCIRLSRKIIVVPCVLVKIRIYQTIPDPLTVTFVDVI